MTFIKSKEFLVWLALNAVFPICVVMLFSALDFAMEVQRNIVLFVALVIFCGNIFAIIKYRNFRMAFAIIIVLNLFSLVAVGDVSFVTALPYMPLVFSSIYHLILQAI